MTGMAVQLPRIRCSTSRICCSTSPDSVFTFRRIGRSRSSGLRNTHAVARSLTAAEFTPAQADAITDAVRQAAEYGDQVTSDQFKTGLAELRTEMAGQRAGLTGQFAELGGQITEQRAEVAGGAHRNRDADRRGAHRR